MDRRGHRGATGSVAVIREPGGERLDLDLPAGAILSLEQIRAIRSSNEYTEGPAVAARRPPAPAPRLNDKHERTHEVILVNVNNNYEARPTATRPPALSRSTSMGSAGSSGSSGSASSEQGLLAQSPPSRHQHHRHHHHHHHNNRPEQAVRTQPKSLSSPMQPLLPVDALLKQPVGFGPPLAGKGDLSPSSPHQFICERCGKCKCSECTAPRMLPSCLACNGQCLCSAESLVEHGTCMCLVKGLFYHCSNDDDDGDSCADRPCSLSRPRCLPRFLCMGLMAPLFPCLLCYPPAKACVKACQHLHDRINRPGCRCKNSNTVYCKLQGWGQGQGHGLGQGKPS
ncbi:protein sprouty homolog 1 [Colossoma macropomum]|uniref:protein sprouty homolog 1 n=1 Tax=Colossoma macropomum TaxID=42526 RepID=UPI00186552A5|nr:protein sprouty homolog 1 [Colossoma macropomum]